MAAGGGSAYAGVDPDAGSEAGVAPGRAVAAVAESDCDLIGDYLNLFAGTSRYRGNVYHIEHTAVLKEIQMQLAFSGTTDLHVAIHQQQADGTYTRYPRLSSDIVIPGASGTNAPFWYTTGPLNPQGSPPGVPLDGGFNYAIAFAWGSKSISYGRDNQSYPLPFEVGEILGLVAAGPLPPPPDPLVPETFPEFLIFTSGAYSMQLCFAPEKGACCSQGAFAGRSDCPSPNCCEVLQPSCTGPGSSFYGERTRCADTPCVFGACCFPCGGQCGNGYTGDSCLAAGGVVQWAGVSCPANPTVLCPPVTGACCASNGNCTEVCRALCAGVFHEDGTTCTPNLCKGACCIPGSGCFDKTPLSCDTFHGQFRGLGTACKSLPPELECGGACCYGDQSLTSCTLVDPRTLCAFDSFNHTVYRGDGTTCPANPQPSCGLTDPIEACCLPDGTCVNTTFAACHAVGVNGEFIENSLCEGQTAGCLNVKACCLPNGDCAVLTDAGCTGVGGSRPASGATACGLSTCTTGACCFSSGPVCKELTQASCTSSGGNYRGNGTNCNTPALVCPGIGACCRYDGDCFDDFTAAQCTTIGGTYEQNASVCSPTLDCDQRGACCAITGTCLLLTDTQCTGIGGDFKGIGTACAANTCPAGACCLATGCDVRTVSNCASSGGVFHGVDVACTPDPCISGACCTDRICSTETEADCVNDGGSFIGEDVPCTADRCFQGACCLSTGCEMRTPSDCAGSGGPFAFQGVDDVCAAGLCVFGACCNGETCSSQTRHTCERDGGTYLGDGVACSATVCTLGACCQSETCSQLQELLCPSPGGVFLGRGVACAADTCHSGGCCRGDACHTDIKLLCTRNGGAYLGDGALCGTGVCAIGACCTAGQCQAVPSLTCSAGSGAFFGVGTVCGADTCTQGACCKNDGCTQDFPLPCTQTNGVFLGPGLECGLPGSGICHIGACCRAAGCESAINYVCTHDGGVFVGLHDLCDVDTCTLGACCDGVVCRRDIRLTCVRAGDVFRGLGTSCDSSNPCCTTDAQCDDGRSCTLNDRCVNSVCVHDWHAGDTEWQQMQDCLFNGGPNKSVPPGCDCYDIDRNDHVDLRDVARFWVVFTPP